MQLRTKREALRSMVLVTSTLLEFATRAKGAISTCRYPAKSALALFYLQEGHMLAGGLGVV
jgi:hypothetical protein